MTILKLILASAGILYCLGKMIRLSLAMHEERDQIIRDHHHDLARVRRHSAFRIPHSALYRSSKRLHNP